MEESIMYKSGMTLTEIYGSDFSGRLMENWGSKLEAAEAVKGELPVDQRLRLAILLENTQNEINRFMRLNEATQSSDVGPFTKYVFDMITAVMPNLIAEELVSVQPMQQKVGQVFYLKYLFGSQKGNIVKNSLMFDPVTGAANKYNYSSETIEEEMLGTDGATSYTGNLAYTPVVAGSVEISCGNTTLVETDAGDGTATLAATGVTGTLNYSTGAFSITFNSETSADVVATYQYNQEFGPSVVPEVTFKVDETIIRAQNRRLKALYAFSAGYDVKMAYGIDIDLALLEAVTSEILHEIDGEIMNDLYVQAGNTASWDKTPASTEISAYDHKLNFLDHLVECSNKIYMSTQRASGNFIVCGRDAANIIESFGMPRFQPATSGRQNGPCYIGVIDGKWKVYKNPYYADSAYLVGYKGDMFLDAGYVYAPYLPIFATQFLMTEDFVGRRGFATAYGKKMLNPYMYVKGTITAS
jgi:hypothetical protein